MRFALEALGNAFIVNAIELDIKLVKLAQGNHAATLVPVRVSPPWTSPHFDRSDYSVVEAQGTTADVMEVGDSIFRTQGEHETQRPGPRSGAL
jgi:hypothetical protein